MAPPRRRALATFALAAFFVSGLAGLVHEVCWIRRASLVFGSTTQALSTVLAVFFLGSQRAAYGSASARDGSGARGGGAALARAAGLAAVSGAALPR